MRASVRWYAVGTAGSRIRVLAFSAIVAIAARTQAAVLFGEDFESGNAQGWTMGPAAGDTATQGAWIIGDPVGAVNDGEPSQPEFPANGSGCAFTGQNPTGSPSAYDVDDGVAWLLSPPIDLTSTHTATLTYTRWYYLHDLNEDDKDYFKVQVRDVNSSAWTTVEFLGDDVNYNAWEQVSYSLEGLVTLPATIRVRFGASDGPYAPGFDTKFNIIEGAIDDVQITGTAGCTSDTDCAATEYCDLSGECAPYGDGDFDHDGDVDLADLRAFQCCFGLVAADDCLPANLAGDVLIWHEDAIAIVDNASGPH
ncbi:MAG: hypothetical protein H6817_04600 [Phycisphaerales bacterium]|nr:hypothetical protein [Phycisphaerales bacterium]